MLRTNNNNYYTVSFFKQGKNYSNGRTIRDQIQLRIKNMQIKEKTG